MNKPILHLNLIKKWFDIIGEVKLEEYREITPYWERYFSGNSIRIKGKWYNPNEVIVCFSNGYAKDRPQKFFNIKELRVGVGNPIWGATPDKNYFVIVLGERILTNI
jgi:hypothetical protein